MVKHTQTIRRLLPTNCLSVFNHFVELTLKRLKFVFRIFYWPGQFTNKLKANIKKSAKIIKVFDFYVAILYSTKEKHIALSINYLVTHK